MKKISIKKAPKEIDRIDKPNTNIPYSQYHVHEKKTDAAYNLDGTIHDKNKGVPNFSKKTIEWLNEHGWNIKL